VAAIEEGKALCFCGGDHEVNFSDINDMEAQAKHTALIDWRGNVYTVGDTILYPRASGRSLEMQEGRVVAIKPYNFKRYVYSDSDEVEEMRYKVQVDPIRSSRFSTGGYRSVEKVVTIEITTNITKIGPSLADEVYREPRGPLDLPEPGYVGP